MKYWKAGIIFLIAFIAQTSLLNLVSIMGYTPNLLLCFVIAFAFLYEDKLYSIVWGAFFGVLYDVCFGITIGPTAIPLVIVGLLVLVLRESFELENIINLWISSILSIPLYYALNWVILKVSGNPLNILQMLKILPGTGIYSLVVITIIYLILVKRVIRYSRDRYFR